MDNLFRNGSYASLTEPFNSRETCPTGAGLVLRAAYTGCYGAGTPRQRWLRRRSGSAPRIMVGCLIDCPDNRRRATNPLTYQKAKL